jgi:hypothetical protein
MNPDPFDLIEEATKRANALRRSLERLANAELDANLKSLYAARAEDARRLAGQMFDDWDALLVTSMQNWQLRAGVTFQQMKGETALLKRSITELEEAVNTVEKIVRAVQRLEAIATSVAKIAAAL